MLDDLSHMPKHAQNRREWDDYWRNALDRASRCNNAVELLCPYRVGARPGLWPPEFLGTLDDLWSLGVRRILFGGNGIRVTPEFAAHLGFTVTAADFSTVATEFARGHPAEEDEWLGVFARVDIHVDSSGRPADFDIVEEDGEARAEMERRHRVGGSLEYVTEDVLDMAGPFDAVYLQRNLDCFTGAGRDHLFARIWSSLIPGGILVIDGYDLAGCRRHSRKRLNAQLDRAGFFVHLEALDAWRDKARDGHGEWNGEYYADRWWADRAADFERVRSGAKMAWFHSRKSPRFGPGALE